MACYANDSEIKETFDPTDGRAATYEHKAGHFDHEGGPVEIRRSILDANHDDVPIIDVLYFTLNKKLQAA